MIELRPDRLQVLSDAGGGHNEYGDPIPVSGDAWSDEIPCRIVQDEKICNRVMQDGTLRFYQYCVVLDDLTDAYKGKAVRLLDKNGNVVCERVVDSRKIGILIQRLWL